MKGNFFMLENRIFKADLDVYEFKVYAYLCMRADKKTMSCFPSAVKIAEECGISESKVRKVTASLADKGFIAKRERFLHSIRGKNQQTSNIYYIEPMPVRDNGGSVSGERPAHSEGMANNI